MLHRFNLLVNNYSCLLTTRSFFIALSGVGWLLDFIVFSLEVIMFKMSAGYANIFSATLAAILVFVASQVLIFKVEKLSTLAVLVYMIYTLLNIVIWAFCIEYTSSLLGQMQLIDLGLASIISKVVITPLSLACNFIVTKHISRKFK